MPNFLHRSVVGTDVHEAFHYVQPSDPGAVGAGLYWLNTTAAPYALSRRDATNTFWISLSGSSGESNATDFAASGLTGAVHPTRFAGATTGGAPVSGSWAQGDFVTDYNAKIWLCTVAGTPGTWHQLGDAGTIDISFGGAGTTITNGVKGDIRTDADLQITGWRLYADTVGSLTVDVWKSTHAGFPPTVANTLIGGGGTLPNIASSDHSQFADLTGWTTLIAAGSILRFNVNSASTITRATLALQVIRV